MTEKDYDINDYDELEDECENRPDEPQNNEDEHYEWWLRYGNK